MSDYRIGNTFRLDHGHVRNGKPTPTYQTWIDMRRRCYNKSHPAYKWYGARGIVVCQDWSLFSMFLRDMGCKPDGMSLDRIDNDGGYHKDNCRWTTALEQNNNSRNVRLLTANGETHSIAEWSRLVGINESTISERLKRQWSNVDAVSKPARKLSIRV
jgi:hypothetical protein